ncbi:DUF4256 domain-containing protein [Carnobacterium funditum]|uniref:DUF4256 domain-containing protein n=1 Tax=Carnobacterium funditum TaxID=2752 RepID=UPI00055326A8|nr:DUF4256 domain-containing protein [Carnobacterium funditum]
MTKRNEKEVAFERREELINRLKTRFDKNSRRHEHFEWEKIEMKLNEDGGKLWSLNEMEKTGGEPDVIGYDDKENIYIFCDCSQESPKGRRSICYDFEGLESRKKNKPEQNAVGMAAEMGIELLTPEQYKELQKVGVFDTKTSSWVKTPVDIRKLGGALFCDYRFGQVFLYHNGAESYYAVRGFRGLLRV